MKYSPTSCVIVIIIEKKILFSPTSKNINIKYFHVVCMNVRGVEKWCYVRCMFKYFKPPIYYTFLFCDDQRPSSHFIFLRTFVFFISFWYIFFFWKWKSQQYNNSKCFDKWENHTRKFLLGWKIIHKFDFVKVQAHEYSTGRYIHIQFCCTTRAPPILSFNIFFTLWVFHSI